MKKFSYVLAALTVIAVAAPALVQARPMGDDGMKKPMMKRHMMMKHHMMKRHHMMMHHHKKMMKEGM